MDKKKTTGILITIVIAILAYQFVTGFGRFLKEIYVCYEKDGHPRACSRDILNKAAKSCGQPDFLVRNTR